MSSGAEEYGGSPRARLGPHHGPPTSRRETLAPDGLGAAIWASVDTGDLEPGEAFRVTRTLLSVGVDTTVVALGNALQCLATHPDQWALLRAEPGLARQAFDECMRFELPVQKFVRTTTAPREIAGIPVPEGRKVVCVLASGNRDPRNWSDTAGVLDITRRPAGHLSFGERGACLPRSADRPAGGRVPARGACRTGRHPHADRTGRPAPEQRPEALGQRAGVVTPA
jgi:cytochrome P450